MLRVVKPVYHIKYNTGDEIWYQVVNERMVVTKLITTDGIFWEEGQTNLRFPTK